MEVQSYLCSGPLVISVDFEEEILIASKCQSQVLKKPRALPLEV